MEGGRKGMRKLTSANIWCLLCFSFLFKSSTFFLLRKYYFIWSFNCFSPFSSYFCPRKQLTLPSLHMYDVGQCKMDREGADSDASSGEQTAARDSVHSPLGPATSPLTFTRASRGTVSVWLTGPCVVILRGKTFQLELIRWLKLCFCGWAHLQWRITVCTSGFRLHRL